MSTKKYDVVVFGATGFTGQFVVDAVARAAEEEQFTWAVAGRNMMKLQNVLKESSQRIGRSIELVPIVIADTSSSASLQEMAKDAKVVLNCVGPYRFHGESVVKACVVNGSHHLDISGEPEFLERMQLLYNKPAKDNGVLVIGSAGFDCIPAEAGYMYLQEKFKEGELTGVESFLSFNYPKGMTANFATYESAVYGLGQWKELSLLRKSLYPEPMPKVQHKLPRHSGLFFSKFMSKWCFPFLGADKSVVFRTIRDHLSTGIINKPLEFLPYVCFPSLLPAFSFLICGILFAFMAKFSVGRYLLLKYPAIFTLGFVKQTSPTREQIEAGSFSMTFSGFGFGRAEDNLLMKPNRQVTAKITGPDAGYITTSICLVQCALVILKEKDTMLHKSGVLTPGAAFTKTSLLGRIEKYGIKISTISDSVSTAK